MDVRAGLTRGSHGWLTRDPWWCVAKVVRCSWSIPSGDKESLNDPHTKILEKKKKKKSPTKEYC